MDRAPTTFRLLSTGLLGLGGLFAVLAFAVVAYAARFMVAGGLGGFVGAVLLLYAAAVLLPGLWAGAAFLLARRGSRWGLVLAVALGLALLPVALLLAFELPWTAVATLPLLGGLMWTALARGTRRHISALRSGSPQAPAGKDS